MRLSEAILLGSTITELNPNHYLRNGTGCLLGMGMNALGARVSSELRERFPWIDTRCKEDRREIGMHSLNTYAEWIGWMARRISEGKCKLERALELIREYEPAELDSTLTDVGTNEHVGLGTQSALAYGKCNVGK